MPKITGALLKQLRQEHEISLEQVASATRIRLEILRDLEDEEYGELASATQARGFLKIYANYLDSMGVSFLTKTSSTSPTLSSSKNAEDLAASSQLCQTETSDPKETGRSANAAGQQETADQAGLPAPIKHPEQVSKPERKAGKETPKAKKPSRPRTPARKLAADKSLAAPSPSQIILMDIGRQLTARRNYLGIPWDLLVEQTHINKDQIIALEQGNLEALSSPIQARGLLNTYARFLNLDSEMLLIRFADALQQRRLENSPRSKPRRAVRILPPVLTAIKRYFTLDLFFGTLLVLGILGFLGWGMTRMISEQQALVSTPISDLPPVIDVLITTPTHGNVQETTPKSELFPANPIPTLFYTPSSPDAALEVVIFPRAYTWIKVTSDGELKFQGRLIPGTAQAFTGKEEIELLTGDIASLRIVFANSELPNTATQFGVQSRMRFDAEGVTYLEPIEQMEETPIVPVPSPTVPALKH